MADENPSPGDGGQHDDPTSSPSGDLGGAGADDANAAEIERRSDEKFRERFGALYGRFRKAFPDLGKAGRLTDRTLVEHLERLAAPKAAPENLTDDDLDTIDQDPGGVSAPETSGGVSLAKHRATVKRMRDAMAQEHGTALTARDEEITTLRAQFRDYALDVGSRPLADHAGLDPEALRRYLRHPDPTDDYELRPNPETYALEVYDRSSDAPAYNMKAVQYVAGLASREGLHWLRRRNESGVGGTGSGGRGAQHGASSNGRSSVPTLTRTQAQNPQLYRAAREQAHKLGVEVRIVE